MKKSLLAIACAAFMAQGMVAQSNQEVTYVEDASQGYLFNQFKDNWFITAEGGANIYFSPGDVHRDWQDRWAPAASIYAGKWFSPIIGVRVGASWLKTKGLSEHAGNIGVHPELPTVNGHYRQYFNEIGGVADVMLNLTNWFGGYKPNRVWNLSFYAGGGGYWTFVKKYDSNGKDLGYKYANEKVLAVRAGIINSFNVSKQVQLSLDLRFTAIDNHMDESVYAWNKTAYDAAAFVGVTYLFPKREWSAPIVPVCPEPENCDALRAQLQAADARIADLESQLQACLDRPVEVVEEAPKAPLATIYFPINVSKLTREDIRVVDAVAEVMKANPDTKYVVTGWADNYTGNDRINTNLRKNRAASVERQLLKAGVPAAQFETTINAGNLVDLGEKFVALDRATTIQEAE